MCLGWNFDEIFQQVLQNFVQIFWVFAKNLYYIGEFTIQYDFKSYYTEILPYFLSTSPLCDGLMPQCYCMQLQLHHTRVRVFHVTCQIRPKPSFASSTLDQTYCTTYLHTQLLEISRSRNRIIAKKSQIFQRFCPLELRICTMRFIFLVRQVLLHLLEKFGLACCSPLGFDDLGLVVSRHEQKPGTLYPHPRAPSDFQTMRRPYDGPGSDCSDCSFGKRTVFRSMDHFFVVMDQFWEKWRSKNL